MRNIIINRYFNSGSKIHTLNSKAKLALWLTLIISCFSVDNLLGLMLLFILLLITVKVARFKIKFFLNSTKYILWLVLFMSIFILISSLIQAAIFSEIFALTTIFWIMSDIATLALKLYIFIGAAFLLNLTTTQSTIINTLYYFLKPLEKWNIQVYKYTFITILTIKFIPEISNIFIETLDVQKIKGSFYQKKLNQKIEGLTKILIITINQTLTRSENLANNLEARGFEEIEITKNVNLTEIKANEWMLLIIVGLIMLIIGVLW